MFFCLSAGPLLWLRLYSDDIMAMACQRHCIHSRSLVRRRLGLALALFALTSQALAEPILEPRYVRNADGRRHAYYPSQWLQQKLSWQVRFFPHKRGGYFIIPRKNGNKRLYFYLKYHKYKFNNKILTTSWPILRHEKNFYLPYHILFPTLKRLYGKKVAWQGRKLHFDPSLFSAQRLRLADSDQDTPKKNQSSAGSDKKKASQSQSPPQKEKKDQERKHKARKAPSDKVIEPATQNKREIKTIVIDAGHGGRDPGAVYGRGRGRIEEKDIVLKVSRLLYYSMKHSLPNKKIVMTRKSDRFVSLEKRTRLANRAQRKYGNALFVSIHANSSISKRTRGVEIYYLDPNSANENHRFVSALERHELKSKYHKMLPSEFILFNARVQRESELLAKSLNREIKRRISQKSRMRGTKRADFVVLRGSLMPAVLVELGFLTNARERKLLQQENYQKRLVLAIQRGLVKFLYKYRKLNWSDS